MRLFHWQAAVLLCEEMALQWRTELIFLYELLWINCPVYIFCLVYIFFQLNITVQMSPCPLFYAGSCLIIHLISVVCVSSRYFLPFKSGVPLNEIMEVSYWNEAAPGFVRSAALPRPHSLVHLSKAMSRSFLQLPVPGASGSQVGGWFFLERESSFLDVCSYQSSLRKIILQITGNNLTPKYFLWKGRRDVFSSGE